jgi:hypothetical protein
VPCEHLGDESRLAESGTTAQQDDPELPGPGESDLALERLELQGPADEWELMRSCRDGRRPTPRRCPVGFGSLSPLHGAHPGPRSSIDRCVATGERRPGGRA